MTLGQVRPLFRCLHDHVSAPRHRSGPRLAHRSGICRSFARPRMRRSPRRLGSDGTIQSRRGPGGSRWPVAPDVLACSSTTRERRPRLGGHGREKPGAVRRLAGRSPRVVWAITQRSEDQPTAVALAMDTDVKRNLADDGASASVAHSPHQPTPVEASLVVHVELPKSRRPRLRVGDEPHGLRPGPPQPQAPSPRRQPLRCGRHLRVSFRCVVRHAVAAQLCSTKWMPASLTAKLCR